MAWHAWENRAALDIDAMPALIEAEDAVCAYARDRQIGKGKLRPRISAGTDARAIDQIIVQRSQTWRCVASKNSDIANKLRDSGFFFLTAKQWQRDCAGENKDRPETAKTNQGIATIKINLPCDEINYQDQ